MKKNIFKRKTFLILIAIGLISCGITFAVGTAGLGGPTTVYAMESEEVIGCEGIEEIDREVDSNLIDEESLEELENNMMLSGGGGRSSDTMLIS